MRPRAWIAIGAALGALAVAAGAFGAHALKGRLTEEATQWWRTAALYHALHALALVAFGLFRERAGTRSLAGVAFALGVLVFSGTLYAMALGGPRWLGAVTPLGGIALMLGWLDFALQALRSPPRSQEP